MIWILQSDWLIHLEKNLVILDNLGWYCDVTNMFIRQRQIQIVTWNNRNYVSPSNEGRHIVLVWFFLLPFPLLLLLSEACPDHNFFVFPDRSIIFGIWVHDHKAVSHTIMTFVGPWPLTSRSNNCFLNSIFLSGP